MCSRTKGGDHLRGYLLPFLAQKGKPDSSIHLIVTNLNMLSHSANAPIPPTRPASSLNDFTLIWFMEGGSVEDNGRVMKVLQRWKGRRDGVCPPLGWEVWRHWVPGWEEDEDETQTAVELPIVKAQASSPHTNVRLTISICSVHPLLPSFSTPPNQSNLPTPRFHLDISALTPRSRRSLSIHPSNPTLPLLPSNNDTHALTHARAPA